MHVFVQTWGCVYDGDDTQGKWQQFSLPLYKCMNKIIHTHYNTPKEVYPRPLATRDGIPENEPQLNSKPYQNCILFLFFSVFKASTKAYGSSQAKGRMGAAAAGLHHSHISARSEPHFWPVLQLVATLNPLNHWVEPGIKPSSSWMGLGWGS